jgi:hypothetical protein
MGHLKDLQDHAVERLYEQRQCRIAGGFRYGSPDGEMLLHTRDEVRYSLELIDHGPETSNPLIVEAFGGIACRHYFEVEAKCTLFFEGNIRKIEICSEGANRGRTRRLRYDQASGIPPPHVGSPLPLDLPDRLPYGGSAYRMTFDEFLFRSQRFARRPSPADDLIENLGGNDLRELRLSPRFAV